MMMQENTENYIELRKKVIRKEYSHLNDMQFRAAVTTEGPVLVLAGAGSGKTTVLVNRIEYMIRFGNAYFSSYVPEDAGEYDLHTMREFLSGGASATTDISASPVRPWQILAITFTNKAAGELKERIISKVGEDGNEVAAGTFHSVCAKILRVDGERIGYSSHFTIYDTDDQKRMLKSVYRELDIDEKYLPMKYVMKEISGAKDSLIGVDEYAASCASDPRKRLVAKVYALYSEMMAKADAMDFDDLIVNTVKLFRQEPEVVDKYRRRWRYIMVDEYQDTNHAQYAFVSLLAEQSGNLCVVGDDDQSIYRFRGATIRNILEFEDEYPGCTVIRLEQNYRSTGIILDAANAVIANNKGRKGKNLWTAYEGGDKIRVHTASDQDDEARFVTDEITRLSEEGDRFRDSAVLYRTNAQSRAFENVLVRSGIPYRIIGGFRFYERKEVKDVLAYLQFISNHNDTIRLARIINEPKRGIGDTTVENISMIASGLGIGEYEVLSNAAAYPSISRAAAKLADFRDLIDRLTEMSEASSVSALCEAVLTETGYADSLKALGDEGIDKYENVMELVNSIRLYEKENPGATLSSYLEEVSLISDVDKYDETTDAVVLMTIHSAKGLEFKNVFLVGMEEGLFPGSQSIFSGPEEIEEERRLAYVAITRAKRRLYILNAYTRMTFGQTSRNVPSRFLGEIPESLCKVTAKARDSYGFGEVRFAAGKPQATHTRETIWSQQKKTDDTPKTVYAAGERVRHRMFGEGVILKTTPMGNDTFLEINFDGVGVKKLMANFAKLEKI